MEKRHKWEILFNTHFKMNVVRYILIVLFGLLLTVIGAVIYWIPFMFRHRVLWYMLQRVEEDDINKVFKLKANVKKWKLYLHPYFWMFCFTTGLTSNYSGYYWYKRELKKKWFPNVNLESVELDYYVTEVKPTLINKLRYFYICYCWQGLRNSHWAFSEWFFREGKYKENELVITKSDAPYGLAELIMPELKWDEGNDGGRQIRYFYEANGPSDEWRTTHEGIKIMHFTTYRGNKRFYYGYCKIKPLYKIKRILAIEQLFGWNWWNGIPVLHNKYIFLKMDETALAKYNKYIDLLKEIKH